MPAPRSTHRALVAGAVVAVAALVAAAGSSALRSPDPGAAAAVAGDAAVSIEAPTVTMTDDLRFTPATITVAAGATVVWRNTSSVMHTVTAAPGRASNPDNVRLPEGADPFDSGEIQPGGTFRHTFTVPGTYRYFCVPHEGAGMVAEVRVTG